MDSFVIFYESPWQPTVNPNSEKCTYFYNNECIRLIVNYIVFYNATLLSNLLLVKQKRGDAQRVEILRHISPIAWQHINFFGCYIFITLPDPVEVEAIIKSMAHFNI